MTEKGYKNRVKRYLTRKGVSVSDAKIKKLVKENYGKTAPSVAVKELLPSSDTRKKSRDRANVVFDKILIECCLVFKVEKQCVKDNDDSNSRNLKSAASYVALRVSGVRPAVAISEALGLPTPSSAYHASYRAEKLINEDFLFAEAINKIKKNLKIK